MIESSLSAGWEKAEAEALTLRSHLESVTLSKLTAEDCASHLDGALKECMRQIRNLKEEHEQKLQELTTKTKQWEMIKRELEAKIANLDQELLRSEAENAALSRSLQERSSMFIKISEEKSQAEAEVELLRSNIETCQREIHSLKYEVHVVSKELEIRNEEKKMSLKSAEAANKQHMEAVKKIAKLEAECQRLRGLVRKRLPGPAALAQMKQEVESWGRECGETRLKRSPVKPPNQPIPSASEFSLDSIQKVNKDNEFLTARLLAMEEETKMLKEALAKRNSELQASRNLCAKTATKLQCLESQLQLNNHQLCQLKSDVQVFATQNSSRSPSITSISEDGNDDAASCAESGATSSISERSQIQREKNNGNVTKIDSANNLALMDDFLEMEKLACLSNDSSGATLTDSSKTNTTKVLELNDSGESMTEKLHVVSTSNSLVSADKATNKDESPTTHPGSDDLPPLQNLRLRILSIFESVSKDTNPVRILEEIKHIVQEGYDFLCMSSVTCISDGKQCSDGASNRTGCPGGAEVSTGKETGYPQDSDPAKGSVHLLSQDLADAITRIHEFVVLLGKEANTVADGDDLSQKIEDLSVTFDKVLRSETSSVNFFVDLSQVLAKASELRFSFQGYKCTESETTAPDCIDKVALPEDKLFHKGSSGESHQINCTSIFNPEVPDCGNIVTRYESNSKSCEISLEDYEQLKLQRDSMANDLEKYLESLEMTKSELQEKEQLLTEVKSQLASAQNSNNLAETQLKCMAESYRTLERRAKELEGEVSLLREKMETLEDELKEERNNHQSALARCQDLEYRLQRLEPTRVV